MLKRLKATLNRLGWWYVDRVNRTEFEAQRFVRINERPIEYRFVFEQLMRLSPVTVLDVGTGVSALPSLMRLAGFVVTAVDNTRDYWTHPLHNRHYHIVNDDITRPRPRGPFDLVTCVSTLEHIHDHAAAFRGMFALLKERGHLVLTHPYNETVYVPNAYALPDAGYGGDAPYVCQVFSRRELDGWLQANGGVIQEQEYWQCFTGSLWTVGAPVNPPRRVAVGDLHQLTCLLIRKGT